MNMFEVTKVKDEIVKWIRKFFEENGKDCNAIVGVSGGIDSTVVAALCVETLGNNRVIGVVMPEGYQNDINDAYEVCDLLDIECITIDILNAVKAIKHGVKQNLNDVWSLQSSINLPPRIRMATLYAVSQSMNGRVANTCNLSEDWIGYSTRYGDSVGDFSPLSKLTKTEVKQLGRLLDIPEDLVNKVPSDGLCGESDEERFGFTYDVLDKYIRTGEIDDEIIKNKIDCMHEKNLFKLELMPCFEYTGE